MYFYEIEVYHSLFGSEKKIVMGHDDRLDNHQLNIIVQEAFDECIEKYIDRSVLDKGEEACRMEVGTIFEEHLPSQLKNHGFKSIKIAETCSIMGGVLFCDNGVNNPVLKDRYKDEVLPPCGKCIRKEYYRYDDNCVVPNIRKDNNLPTTCVVNDKNSNAFNINVLKQYFTNSDKTAKNAYIADIALNNMMEEHNSKGVYTEWGAEVGDMHEGNLSCEFDSDEDKEKSKKLLGDYGFVLEDDEDGFWITGVKE